MTLKSGCVYLIGAGCGEKDLITLRGLARLQQCDVIVYDDLIDSKLLDTAPPGTQTIYMGKRQGKHSAQQEEISQTLIELAHQGKRVARLKGGDPFVFGRGGEEALALQKAGVPFEEIPGISSCIAIPALAGIPVTHRGISRSFHVITAHTKDDDQTLLNKMKHLAALDGTLVFLMGLSRLDLLMQGLMQAGKEADTPAAVISGGNAPHPAVVRGTLQTIAQSAKEAEICAPAVIVVGETAAMNLLSTAESKPLSRVHVGVTGTASFTQKLCYELREQGAHTTMIQQSRIEALSWEKDIPYITNGGCHWLVFTSANGVRIFFQSLKEQQVDLRCLSKCKFAVIGHSTGQTLSEYGFYADFCPAVYTSEELAQGLCKAVAPDEDVCLLRAQNSAAILPELLVKHGISVMKTSLYKTAVDPQAIQLNTLNDIDYLTFGSAGGVEQFFEVYHHIPQKTVCVCIGEITAKAFSKYDKRTCLVAENATISSMVQAICLDYKSKQ